MRDNYLVQAVGTCLPHIAGHTPLEGLPPGDLNRADEDKTDPPAFSSGAAGMFRSLSAPSVNPTFPLPLDGPLWRCVLQVFPARRSTHQLFFQMLHRCT